MRWQKTQKAQSGQTVPQVTPDFNKMISIVSWNSAGFFFTDFIIPFSGLKMGGTGLEIGIMFSFIVLGSAMSALFIGYLTDRMRKTTLILIGAIGRGASYAIIYVAALIGSLALMTVGTFVLGLLVEFYWVPFDSLVAAKSCKDNRSYAFGKRHAAVGKGMLLGGVAGVAIFAVSSEVTPGVIALLYSPMLLYCACNVIGGLLFLRNVDERLTYSGCYANTAGGAIETDRPASQETGMAVPAKINGRNRPAAGFALGFALLLASYFLSATNNSIAKPFLQIYMLKVIIDDPVLVLIAYAPAGTMAMLFSPRLGKLADKLDPKWGIMIFSSLGALVTIVVINVRVLWIFSALLVADNVLGLASNLLLANIFSRISIKNRGKVLGVGSAINNTGGAIGPIAGGILMDTRGIATPFIASIFIELSFIPLYLLALKRLKPHFAEQLATSSGAKNEKKATP
jgi:MFS family permease